VLLQGQRNYFSSVQFAGGGNSTNRGGTVMRSLTIDGQGGNGEHVFDQCSFGLDTVDTAGANYELEISNFSQRLLFRSCVFLRRTVVGGAGGGFINVPANGTLRWTIFDNCFFLNDTDGTALTTGIKLTATSGLIIMHFPISAGMTGWTGGAKANFLADGIVGATTSGLALQPSS
jgi:hypothetical protein